MSKKAVADLTLSNEPKKSRSERENRKAQIAAYLDDFLWKNKYTEERLAEASQVDRSTIYRILTRKVLANENTLTALARIAGVGIFIAAGYSLESLPAEFADAPASKHSQLTTTTVQIPDLDDPELTFYLRQLGQMPEKTREIIRGILRAESSQLNTPLVDNSIGGGSGVGDSQAGSPRRYQRPDFARKWSPDEENQS